MELWILPEIKHKYPKHKIKHKLHLYLSELSVLQNYTVMLNLIQKGGGSVKLHYETLHIGYAQIYQKTFTYKVYIHEDRNSHLSTTQKNSNSKKL